MNRTTKQAGVSLIEVLVVIVILLVGIFSVIRLFPPGFLVNRQTEDMTRAARLAQQEADRAAANSANLPDNIVPVRPVQNGPSISWRVDTTSTPDDLTDLPVEPIGQFPWSYYGSNVNKVRRILGETLRIPQPSPTTTGRGSIYMLNHGPFMDVSWDGQNRSIFISGAPMVRRRVEAGNSTDPNRQSDRPSVVLGGPSTYGIDYGEDGNPPVPVIGFQPANYDRQYLMSYSYYDTNNTVVTIIDQVVTVPADTDDWITVPIPGARPMVPFSETVARKFIEVPPTTIWSPVDPYQFYLESPSIANLANFGVVVFNPLGHDYTEYTNAGPTPLTARIDYDVLDWHIIREDRPMPAGSPYQVYLTLTNIKKIGDIEDDQSTYDGLFRGVPANANQPEVIVYNTSTGQLIPPVNYTINHKSGIVQFTDAFGAANAAGTFRFFYQAQGDWALQIQKASSNFRRRVDPAVGYNEYYLGTGGAGGSTTRMYFPLSEAGKTVSIRDIWYTDTAGRAVSVNNEAYRINANRALFENINNVPLTWIDVIEKHSDATAWDYTSSGLPAAGVQGVSFRARVIWKNGSVMSGTGADNVVRSRYRKVDVDTILTRATQSGP
jgi:type II secretory pathway pseudopilin PulG